VSDRLNGPGESASAAQNPGAAKDFEILSDYGLDAEDEARLFSAQTECTFIWSTKDGSPFGVIMSFVFRDGHFWLTASWNRGRVRAVGRDPRVALVVTSTGTALGHGKSVTYRGTCQVHTDEETKRWFYAALAERRFPDDERYRAEFVENLDSARRVVLEVTPTERIAIDLAKMHRGATMYGD
jgi:nitroimidazol reductase NimA-like FMN-containing flavoprotein (pyridoxamine 5'-phosphate oxidase superfamily)